MAIIFSNSKTGPKLWNEWTRMIYMKGTLEPSYGFCPLILRPWVRIPIEDYYIHLEKNKTQASVIDKCIFSFFFFLLIKISKN